MMMTMMITTKEGDPPKLIRGIPREEARHLILRAGEEKLLI